MDRAIPDWIAAFLPLVQRPDGVAPIQVVRKGGAPADLPTLSMLNDVLANSEFLAFTSVQPKVSDGGGLEGIHNGVHDWFDHSVKSTMNDVPIASTDPIFWMHHANIDRIWAMWQFNHPGQAPNLPANALDDTQQPANVMDPWAPFTELDTRSTVGLGYAYDH